MLKVNLREAETEHEVRARALGAGQGAVRLLAHDGERWGLLIGRCRPGTQLWALPDEQATEVGALG